MNRLEAEHWKDDIDCVRRAAEMLEDIEEETSSDLYDLAHRMERDWRKVMRQWSEEKRSHG